MFHRVFIMVLSHIIDKDVTLILRKLNENFLTKNLKQFSYLLIRVSRTSIDLHALQKLLILIYISKLLLYSKEYKFKKNSELVTTIV